MTISVIIPTLNAEKDLSAILTALLNQTIKPDEIIIVDSASTDDTVKIARSFSNTKLIQITRNEFDHGKTRDMALKQSIGSIVIFLTQDAIPANNEFIAKLVEPFNDKSVAVSTGRQLPKENASKIEKLVREFNYSSHNIIKSKADIAKLGIKTFFSSDVCSAYNREIYIALGGFDYPIKTNEDMFYAAKAIQNGFKTVYTAEAVVYHSHNFSILEQYRRNYIQGYEIARHNKLLENVKLEGEGMRLFSHVSKELLKHGYVFSFIYFLFDCFARLLGSRAGRKAFFNE